MLSGVIGTTRKSEGLVCVRVGHAFQNQISRYPDKCADLVFQFTKLGSP